MTFSFSKYTGCGNDFILVDNRTLFFPSDDRIFIEKLCHRQKGIGADGIILLENSHSAQYRMRIFNADGKEAEMCGNGIRCLYKFLKELEIEGSSFQIETMCRQLEISIKENDVSVQMGDPIDMMWNLHLPNPIYSDRIHYLNTGVPHAVLFFDDIESVDMQALGKIFRHHPAFGNGGANVNAAAIYSNGEIGLRTFERGVEDETLACGTGATAVAIAAAQIKKIRGPITLRPRSDEPLKVDFKSDGSTFSDVRLTGPANFVFKGFFFTLETQRHR